MKRKLVKLSNGLELLASLSDPHEMPTLARVRLRAPLAMADIRPDEGLVERLRAAGIASQWSIVPSQQKSDNFNFQNVADVLPRDGDYISVNFRALSKTVVPGHWLDWTKDDVLEQSVELLRGATVYPNHDFTDVNNWLGSVANVAWDAEGKASDGVPGINAQYKIDALMNARIARGLLMKPPAIHSTSMTVLFEFEYSHPDIALESKWKFFDLLGEEVEGSIVRLIVSRIVEYWEASLVFQGADRLAKQYTDDEEPEFSEMSAVPGRVLDRECAHDFSQAAARAEADIEAAKLRAATGAGGSGTPAGKTTPAGNPPPAVPVPPNSNEEKTMKLTSEQKAKLGIEFDGDDVPESELLKAGESLADRLTELTESTTAAEVEQLKAKAAQADTLVAEKRAEVKRLATIAELGAAEGTLPKVLADDIDGASVERLSELGKYYEPKAAEKVRRSSQEDSEAVEAAGGAELKASETADDPTGGLFS